MTDSNLLQRIQGPADLKSLTLEELDCLCAEIREKLIETVSKNGGHLASNLGVVELTVALYRVFDLPTDKLVWDVGHQCYTHKILSGRLDRLNSIRKEGGLAGFPKSRESVYDPFDTGHSSTSISSAFGIANAKNIAGQPGKVVAVIGDGALSGGLAYEGLNNAGRYKKNFIVVLNDNHMSISHNVGSMARYLALIRTKPFYLRMKDRIERLLVHIPVVGGALRSFLLKSKSALKNFLYASTIFEDMGFVYYGPFDGHNLEKLIRVLEVAQKLDRPVLIHVLTKKGKGYPFAEKDPKSFHGISAFDVETGEPLSSSENFSSMFGSVMCSLAQTDDRVCAITAAMKSGTGLTEFSHRFRDRFFDVGIAEGHAVTFAGGLAAGGMLPVFAVYSTFLQRSYDQIIHDAALQNAKIVLAIDRAGIVGEDGETHQGLFDVSFINTIPNVTVYAPSYFDEMFPCFHAALYKCDGVAAVRYPRGVQGYRPEGYRSSGAAFDCWGDLEAPVAIVTYGRLFSQACLAQERLRAEGIECCVYKLMRIKPLDDAFVNQLQNHTQVFFFEESLQSGGVGERVGWMLMERRFCGVYRVTAVPDCFVPQSSMESALHTFGLDADWMIKTIVSECSR